jgi:hypothetical protein
MFDRKINEKKREEEIRTSAGLKICSLLPKNLNKIFFFFDELFK